ncbi:hypothetical protein Taro_056832, partial [Colocasia esculenta]|nr:hypothetical protein [Colocasia esculenta]
MVAAPLLPSLETIDLLPASTGTLVLPRGLEHSSPPLLHDVWRGRGWKPLWLLLSSLLQRNALQQRNTRMLKLLMLSINRHVLGRYRLVQLGVVMLHQLSNLPTSTWRHVLTPWFDTTVTAPMPGPSAPTKDPTIGTAAHGSEDLEGLTNQSSKICNGDK